MFSGIVEEIGIISEIEINPAWTKLTIAAEKTLADTRIGDSIAVNGVCLTVIEINEKSFCFQAVPETLAKTNLAKLKVNFPVNLERAMLASTRIGGHMVQGHVDTVSRLLAINQNKAGLLYTFELPEALTLLVVEKGFITLDGMSLTVVNRKADSFSIAFIPHTVQATIVKSYQIGQVVNLEVDVMGKYVQQYIEAACNSTILGKNQ